MINLLYCFDSNYDEMSFSYIISVLDKINEKINLYIIHNTNDLIKILPDYISKHKNLNNIIIKKFQSSQKYFPNVENSHVSEATYYRLFLQDYIDDGVDFLIYFDADVICLKNPMPYLKSKIQSMKENKIEIGVMNQPDIPEVDTRSINLGIKSGKYFNAGVMIINFPLWKEKNIKESAIKIISEKQDELSLWDQDVLNIIFDGKFEDIDYKYNYRMDILNFSKSEVKVLDNDIYLLHYFGKSKPWSLKGINYGISEYYQKEYRKFSNKKYHIIHNWKKGSLIYISQIVFSGKIFKLKYPFKFLIESLQSFFK